MYKLRDIILERISRPKAMILAGSPGAGKSSFIEDIDNALIMNIDDIFIRNLRNMGGNSVFIKKMYSVEG